MSVHIALLGAHGMEAGIEFTHGTAVVGTLGENRRRYLELLGATITDGVTEIVGTSLEDLTKAELLDIVADEDIALPEGRVTKAQIIAAIEAHPAWPVLGDGDAPSDPEV